MKAISYFLITTVLLIQSISSLQAQNTSGTDFWLTFGKNRSYSHTDVDLQIRIVGGNTATSGTIYFTDLGTSEPFNLLPQEVFTYNLNNAEKQAVYNTTMGVSNRSIRITTAPNHPVTVYALNQAMMSTDATNVLPITALEKEYYHISYIPNLSSAILDAYAVIAIEDNTNVYHNGGVPPIATLNAGQVYYQTSSTDMTGACITADHPVAFFAVNMGVDIPYSYNATDCLMQQLTPVNTWGNNFFVPVSHLTRDIIRIVASQDNTNITQIGGTLLYPAGGQTSLTGLQAGQFVELEVALANNGCYIQANKSVGLCTYLTGKAYNGLGTSDPSQAWLPAIEQMGKSTMIAPFIPNGSTLINDHRAIIITPFATKDNTKVSIGGGAPAALSNGTWYNNLTVTPQMSFYIMPLTHATASYNFTNSQGLIVMCYGVGTNESYYYLAGSAMRDLQSAFYANDIHFQDLKENPICAGEVMFQAEIEGELHPSAGHLKWYINGVEKVSAADHLTWNDTFLPGEYAIRMWCRFENNDTVSKTGFLKIISCEQNADFYANNVQSQNLKDTTFCAKDVYFRAEIEEIHADPGSLKWFIGTEEYEAARDHLTWSKPFESGVYPIRMEVRFENDETASITGTLKMDVLWIKIRNVRY